MPSFDEGSSDLVFLKGRVYRPAFFRPGSQTRAWRINQREDAWRRTGRGRTVQWEKPLSRKR